MVSAGYQGPSLLMQSAGATGTGPQDTLAPEAAYLRGLGGPVGYSHPENLSNHPHHPQMQVGSDFFSAERI